MWVGKKKIFGWIFNYSAKSLFVTYLVFISFQCLFTTVWTLLFLVSKNVFLMWSFLSTLLQLRKNWKHWKKCFKFYFSSFSEKLSICDLFSALNLTFKLIFNSLIFFYFLYRQWHCIYKDIGQITPWSLDAKCYWAFADEFVSTDILIILKLF